MGANNRRQLARTCKELGLLVRPNAMKVLMQEMESRGDKFLDLLTLCKKRLARAPGPKLVSLQLVEMVLEEERQQEQVAIQKAAKRRKDKIVLREEIEDEIPIQPRLSEATNKPRGIFDAPPKPKVARRKTNVALPSGHTKPWKVVSAFHMPKLVYDSMGRQFHYDFSRKSLMGTAKDLMDMRIQRYELIKQKVDRHREQMRLSPLTTIDRLLGATFSKNLHAVRRNPDEQRTLLGMLRSNPTLGCLELEDPTGSVPLLIETSSQSNLFPPDEPTCIDSNGVYLEGSMVLVRGYQEEADISMMVSNADESSGTIFRCTSIELPPLENKAETHGNLPPSPYSNDFQSGFQDNGLKSPVPIYTLSNLCLDEELCLERVRNVIDRMIYETGGTGQADEDDIPYGTNGNDGIGAILVLFGNFSTDSSTASTALEELARLLHEKRIPSKHSVLSERRRVQRLLAAAGLDQAEHPDLAPSVFGG